MSLLCFTSVMISMMVIDDTTFIIGVVWGFLGGVVYSDIAKDVFRLRMQK